LGPSRRIAGSEIDLDERYEIQSISNQPACAGETITISGTGFGAEGRVYFPSPAGDGEVLVKALLWTDTLIDVEVPPWAVEGYLHLNAFHTVTSECRVRDIYRLGNQYPFTGGLSSIFELTLLDLDDPSLPPLTFAQRDRVLLSWRASDNPTVRVSVSILKKSDGTVLLGPLDVPPPPGGRSWTTIVRIPEIGGNFADAQFGLSPASNCGQTDPLTVNFHIPGGGF
jgi:hypothetical protein